MSETIFSKIFLNGIDIMLNDGIFKFIHRFWETKLLTKNEYNL